MSWHKWLIYTHLGILYQAGLPSAHVLLLPVQHDRCSYPRRVSLVVDCATVPAHDPDCRVATGGTATRRHRPVHKDSCDSLYLRSSHVCNGHTGTNGDAMSTRGYTKIGLRQIDILISKRIALD